MPKKYDLFNPFKYKVVIDDQMIQVTMTIRSYKIKRSFSIPVIEWKEVIQYRNTPYNIHSKMLRLVEPYINAIFDTEERLTPQYMQVCMDAIKVIDKAFSEKEVAS